VIGPSLGLLLVTALLAAGPDPPPCAAECARLAEEGELKLGVSADVCTLRLCQEAARSLYRRGEFEEALRALDHIREGRAGSPSYELDRGVVLYALGRLDEAVASFDRVLETLPSSIRAGTQRAHALTRLGRLEEARAQFEEILDLPGVTQEFKRIRTSSYLLGNIGAIKLRQGDLKGGKADLVQALDEDGSNALAATMLHKVVPSLESGAVEPEAIGLLEKAYEQMSLGRVDDAASSFEQVLERWPRFEPAWWVLGGLHFARLDYAACEDVYGRAERTLRAVTDFGLERIRCTILRYGVTSEEARAAIGELRKRAERDPENRRLKDMLLALDL
jgi:tetratricopeptide (TPR) repeat protein